MALNKETAIVFESEQSSLVGIIHHSHCKSERGVVIVVGGPQTRVGSHRAFVELARFLAGKGIHVLRFDYTGAGDSDGEISSFTQITCDIHAAINGFTHHIPELKTIGLWGLCDAASAISMYMGSDNRSAIVDKLILLNPWVNQPNTQAQTFLKHYYIRRLRSKAFWQKLLTGKVALLTSAKEVHSFSKQRSHTSAVNYVDNMISGLESYDGKLLVLLAENDLVGQEFNSLIAKDKRWQAVLKKNNADLVTIRNANHTFALKEWKDELNMRSLKLLQS